jgi:3-oxoacyl-[acyl-carrier-protein] synthase II
MRDIFITGVGTELAGLSPQDWFAGCEPLASRSTDPLAQFDRKKLRYKDRATILAIMACQAALDDAGIITTPRIAEGFERTGVVASSNFGNLDTVCRTVTQIRSGNAADTSPLDLPNASPNVVAASVAIYFGAGGPNLMVTSGATSGLDALAIAARVVRAGRADRMIVVGAEAETEPVTKLLAQAGVTPEAAFEGAVALIVECCRSTEWPGYARVDAVGLPGDGPERVKLVSKVDRTVSVYEPPTRSGLAYGAMGILQAAFAAMEIGNGTATRAEIVTGGQLGSNTFVRGILESAR